MISILLAMSQNGVIGKSGKLPWYIPEDLRYFKRVTLNKNVVMGRKTFDAIGRPLPNRKNYVVTRDITFSAIGVTVLSDIDAIRKLEGDVFIIGGAEIVEQSIGFADFLYLTQINEEVQGDVSVHIDLSKWKLVLKTPGKGTAHFTYSFTVYERIPEQTDSVMALATCFRSMSLFRNTVIINTASPQDPRSSDPDS